MRSAIRTCPLCEATCGLRIDVDDATRSVVKVRGDAGDVFSHGFLCPKGVGLKELHEDPDRVRTPLLKQADGTFAKATWDEAFAVIAERLPAVQATGGRDAVAAYLGNPAAHQLGALVYGRVLLKALGSKNLFSASTVDQYPKQMASALMFGTGTSVAVPDLDRTDFLLVLGANPLASNGSLMTAPDARGRLRAIRARGGRIVVVDPRRTRTAAEADEHLFIRPGTDGLLLMALLQVLFAEGLASELDPALYVGLDEVRALCADFTPDAVAAPTGIPASRIVALARGLAGAESAAVYGRIGTTTQAFGTLSSWLVDVVNAVTGNLDRPGGAMFPRVAAGGANTKGEPGRGRGTAFGRWGSRVRGLGELFGELPVAALAEEIEVDGPGQVRAFISLAGNPVLSTPNSDRLAAALGDLDFMVSVDIYVNETTRHADVILPAPSALERSHYDLALYSFAIRDVANYSPPVWAPAPGVPDEWEVLLRLTGVVTGQGADADLEAIDRYVALEAIRRETTTVGSPLLGADPERVLALYEGAGAGGVADSATQGGPMRHTSAEGSDAETAGLRGPDRMLDVLLRCGPYGGGYPALGLAGPGLPDGAVGAADGCDGLSIAALLAAPHGIDLGALRPRLPEMLRTPSGCVELAPPSLIADVDRLRDALLSARDDDAMVLVGRRDLRSNNSWMHNLPSLVSGPARCTAWVHPADAARLGLADGEPVAVSARTGTIELPVQVTEDVMPGVVSIPHGWGHDAPGTHQGVAEAHPGVNSNVLTDELVVEPLSGNAVLNGIPVTLAPVAARVPA
jgi:anaerobic selenocysteine-containing dehydrogenase